MERKFIGLKIRRQGDMLNKNVNYNRNDKKQ